MSILFLYHIFYNILIFILYSYFIFSYIYINFLLNNSTSIYKITKKGHFINNIVSIMIFAIIVTLSN